MISKKNYFCEMNTLYFKLILCSLLILTLTSCDTPKSLTKKGDRIGILFNFHAGALLFYIAEMGIHSDSCNGATLKSGESLVVKTNYCLISSS